MSSRGRHKIWLDILTALPIHPPKPGGGADAGGAEGNDGKSSVRFISIRLATVDDDP